MATALDTKIEAVMKELQEIRESSEKKRHNALQAIASLLEKREALVEKMRVVLKEGLDLGEYAAVMEKAAANESPRHALQFGHQVLLLMAIHMMEAQENLCRKTCKQNKKLVKSAERQKRALREQNSEHEIRFMNQLSVQYEGMRKLDYDFRQAIHAQEVVISRLEWKTAVPAFPTPTPVLAASTTEFLHEQSAILLHTHGRESQEAPTSASVAFASSMRNLMELDGAFPPPTEEDLIPTIHQESLVDAIYRPDDEESPVDFVVSIDVLGGIGGGGLSRRRMRRAASFDSVDTMSTAGEELLQGIQSFFVRGGRNSKEDRSIDDSNDWLLE